MQITINVPDTLPQEFLDHRIEEIEKTLTEEAKLFADLSKQKNAVSVKESAKPKNILEIMEKHKLLGCMEGDGQLSVDYKKHLWTDS